SFHLKDVLTTIGEKVCLEVSSCLSLCGSSPFTMDKETVLKGQIQAVASPDDPIRRIMESRILTFLETYLASGHQKPLPTVPGGLSPVQRELEEVAIKFARLVNYNKMVFCPYYDAILISPELFNVDHRINTTSLINSSDSCYSLIFCVRSYSFPEIG
ncbi:TCP11L1 isoform 1, partial [Pongo abelii]